ncbi:MAG TPA: NAD(P)-binding domain-containing protein, partial [Cytophagaceae bacterium]
MSKNYRISIIGTGNVAWHLSTHLEYAGHTIEEVYGRNLNAAKNICSRLYYAKPVSSLDLTKSKARVFFIMVKDDAIEDVAAHLMLPDNAILAHTSGTKPLSLLTHAHS